MQKVVAVAAMLALSALGACKKTGEGEYEVYQPVVGVTKDTVALPTVDVGKDTLRVVTPTVDVTVPGGDDHPDSARRGDARP